MRSMTPNAIVSPHAAEIERLAGIAVQQIPQTFRDHLGDVVFRVEEFADRDMLAAVGLENPWAVDRRRKGIP